MWLGIHATGINIYESDNQLVPKVSFLWSEIRNISFKNKQVSNYVFDEPFKYKQQKTISINDKSASVFKVEL